MVSIFNGISMTSPSITVLMSVYNGEKYLSEAVESILSQTHYDFEFIILNDASTDKSYDILMSYQDPRIQLVNNEMNLGLAKSLNKGLMMAKGHFIARMDDDDISEPYRLETQYKILKENERIGLVSSWAKVINEKGEVIAKWERTYCPEDNFYELHFRNCVTHPTVMFRKELILRLNGYNESFKAAQDFELWNRLSKIAQIYHIPQHLIKYRRIKGCISSDFRDVQLGSVGNVVKRELTRICGMDMTDREIEAWQKRNFLKKIDIRDQVKKLIDVNDHILEKESAIINAVGLNKNVLVNLMNKRVFDSFLNCFGRFSILALVKGLLSLRLRLGLEFSSYVMRLAVTGAISRIGSRL